MVKQNAPLNTEPNFISKLKIRNDLQLQASISVLAGSFAGLGFLSWYLAGKIKAFDRGGHVAKLCIVVLPLLIAAMVGVSRVDDYWHHWQDVFTGGILGRFAWKIRAAFHLLQIPLFQSTISYCHVGFTLQDWWLLPSATFSSSHHLLVNKVMPLVLAFNHFLFLGKFSVHFFYNIGTFPAVYIFLKSCDKYMYIIIFWEKKYIYIIVQIPLCKAQLKWIDILF